MKKYFISNLYTIIITLFATFIISFVYYFNLISFKTNSMLIYFIVLLSIITGCIKYSKNNNNKGYISGLIYSIPWLLIVLISSLLIYKTFNVHTLVYVLSILIFSVISGIIGKNIKKEQ